jgi:CheY-like chemotaxis protein
MSRQKILIVDDSKLIRMQVRDMLPDQVDILEAGDGVEGLTMIDQERPSLVLLDFFMPKMNGSGVILRVQENPALQHIPIVMMSGRQDDVMAEIPDLTTKFEFVSKPFEKNTLMLAIKSAMAKAKVHSIPAASASATQGLRPASATATQGLRPASASATSTSATQALRAASASATGGLQSLQAEMAQLRQQNEALRNDLESVKKQMAQLMAFVRQKVQ